MADPKPLPFLDYDDLWRFYTNVNKRGPDDCWEWKGTRYKTGYGAQTIGERTVKAHRLAYFLATGEDPCDRLVCHHCDNPPCVNPMHLFPGTPGDNNRDRKKKNGYARGYKKDPALVIRGERHHNSKLNEVQIVEIRDRAQQGESFSSLGQAFQVTSENISAIVRRKAWAHI